MFSPIDRPDRAALDALIVQTECAIDQIEATLRDNREHQTNGLKVMAELHAARRTSDLEEAANIYGRLVTEEMKLHEIAGKLRAEAERWKAAVESTDAMIAKIQNQENPNV